jgi:GNAT superfamily N-acetyltransferase
MRPRHTIRLATIDDAAALGATQARAFFDDPLQVWALPDASTRLGLLETMFAAQIAIASIPLGASYTDDTCSVGAFWAPPDRWRIDDDDLARLAPVARAIGDRFRWFALAFEAMASNHPAEPHWYLGGLGTDPPRQGEGLASAALAPILSHCDANGQPAYLESTKESNIGFYERHGFAVTGEIHIPEDGPCLWKMWRRPSRDVGQHF